MENKQTTAEFKATAKEWKDLSSKTFHQVNKALGTKGRIIVVFGIAIVWLLGAVVAHMDDRYDRGFDRDYGNMMQGRESMMWNSRRGDDQFQERGFGRNQDGQWIQGCSQKAAMEINSKNPSIQSMQSHENCPFADQMNSDDAQKSDGFFGRMETRMKQMFGSDQKWDIQVSVPETTIVVSTGSTK